MDNRAAVRDPDGCRHRRLRWPYAGSSNNTGVTMVLAVDPKHLRRAAEKVRVAALNIDELLASNTSRLAVPGQRTWESACRLETAVEVWRDHLGQLATTLHQTATRLASVADLFVAADQAALARIRSAAWAG
ncbi:MAG: hypothetical protein IRY85_12820 [Micromonosporaceae bacterium]|nr:hypothetical protein [Micromonosporaceae bacterium]